jgi:hypothetical protein
MKDLVPRLEDALVPHGFRRVKQDVVGGLCRVLLKRQTLNINRAVAVIYVDALPNDLQPLLRKIKKETAFRCGFFPLFYGIGTQLVLVTSSEDSSGIDPVRFIDKYDNQWSIIQSVFIVRTGVGLVATARTWGQHISAKYQDAIESVVTQQNESVRLYGIET